MVTVKDFKLNYNKNLFKVNYSLKISETESFLFSSTVETLAVITKALFYIKLRIPANQNDKNFSKVFINTMVDLEKGLNGLQNPFMAMVRDDHLKLLNFEIKFPFKKVLIMF